MIIFCGKNGKKMKFLNKQIFFVFLLLNLLLFSYYTQAQEVEKMEEVFVYVNESNSDTLVIFDVDMVLVQPSSAAFQMANMKKHRSILKQIMQEVPKEKLMIFLSLATISCDPILLDQRLPEWLKQLMERGVPTMALTANLTGQLLAIQDMEKWRIGALRQLGIDFSLSSPNKERIIFSDLPSYRGNYSVYNEGILFVNGTACSKGEALVNFFHKANFFPKKVIFIDDREENLTSVREAISALNPAIEFKGIHFTGANDYPSEIIPEEQFETSWRKLAEMAKTID